MSVDPEHDADRRFDLLVLTAADSRQAAIYERAVGRLLDCGVLPVDDLLVVPDPGGRRVGSGGATLEAVPNRILITYWCTRWGASLNWAMC